MNTHKTIRSLVNAAFILTAVSLLLSCTPAGYDISPVAEIVTGTATLKSNYPTQTLTPIKPTFTLTFHPSTLTPTSTPIALTATPGTALPPEDIITYRPIEILSELPATDRPQGALVLDGFESFLLYFDETMSQELIGDFYCLSTSPNGQWLAYCSLDMRRLHTESADRLQQNSIWLEHNLIDFGDHLWISNHQMVFASTVSNADGAYPSVIVDPFTGKHTRPSTEYPGYLGSICGPEGTKQYNYLSLVYDPSLTRVVYPDMESDPENIVLWDLEQQSALAKIEEGICFGNFPLWSPDGQQFIVANYLKESTSDRDLEEFVRVGRDGQIEWLTHFADYFRSTSIGEGNWSPDGNQVAFWLETEPDFCPKEIRGQNHLAIFDGIKHQVFNLCVSGTDEPPTWSFDNRFIAIRSYDSNNQSRILLVNPEDGWAATLITISARPVGWLDRVISGE